MGCWYGACFPENFVFTHEEAFQQGVAANKQEEDSFMSMAMSLEKPPHDSPHSPVRLQNYRTAQSVLRYATWNIMGEMFPSFEVEKIVRTYPKELAQYYAFSRHISKLRKTWSPPSFWALKIKTGSIILKASSCSLVLLNAA